MKTIIQPNFIPKCTIRDGSSTNLTGLQEAIKYLTRSNAQYFNAQECIQILNTTPVTALFPHRCTKKVELGDFVNYNKNFRITYQMDLNNNYTQVFSDIAAIYHINE